MEMWLSGLGTSLASPHANQFISADVHQKDPDLACRILLLLSLVYSASVQLSCGLGSSRAGRSGLCPSALPG